jgi:hypothetical protein
MTNPTLLETLQRYQEYQPTEFDPKGKALGDHQNWYVSNIGLNRDSNLLDQSNFTSFAQALKDIEPEGNHWQIHRFGHWSCGWFEILILNPETSEVLNKALEIMESLKTYLGPLDDVHHSNLEHKAFMEWIDDGIFEVRFKLEDDILLEPFESKITNSEISDCLNEIEWTYMDDGSPYIDIEENWTLIKMELSKVLDFETLSPSCNGSNRVYFFVQAFYKDIIGANQKTLDDVLKGKNLYKNSEEILENINDLKVVISDKVWNCCLDDSGSIEAVRYHY